MPYINTFTDEPARPRKPVPAAQQAIKIG